MTISVIIPAYNRAATVAQSIDSVLAQTRPADQIIVVDDGSTDATPAVLARYARRIVVVRQPNAGVSAARNAGIAGATGTWIAFLDSDDVFRPGWLALVARHRDTDGVGVLIADHVFEGPGYARSLFDIRGFTFAAGRATRVEHPLPLVVSGLSLNSMAARRDWLLAAGGFDPAIRMYEDLDLLARLAGLGPWAFLPEVVSRVRRLDDPEGIALTSIAARDTPATRRVLAGIFERLSREPSLSSADRRVVRKALSGARFGEARALRTAGRIRASLAPLWQSAVTNPSPLKGWGKAALLLAAGESRYARATSGSRGFYREDFEA